MLGGGSRGASAEAGAERQYKQSFTRVQPLARGPYPPPPPQITLWTYYSKRPQGAT